MALAKEIMKAIEAVAPIQLQEDYDNAGLQCGDPNQEITRVLCCMDVTERIIDEAKALGCQMIVSHHPLLFRGLKKISAEGDYISRCVYRAIKEDIVLYAAHTNLDNAAEGVNMKMVEKLCYEVEEVQPLVPIDIESQTGSGKIFDLKSPISLKEFKSKVAQVFKADSCNTNNDYDFDDTKLVKRIALCGGAGVDFIRDAERQKADVYITGEIGYHRMFGHPSICLIELGHWESEQYTVELLNEIITKALPQVEVVMSSLEKPVKHVD